MESISTKLEKVLKEVGFTDLTEIQKIVIPIIKNFINVHKKVFIVGKFICYDKKYNVENFNKFILLKIKNGKNIIFRAPTGYGKTLAAFLPLLDKLDPDSDGIQLLYITPSIIKPTIWCARISRLSTGSEKTGK